MREFLLCKMQLIGRRRIHLRALDHDKLQLAANLGDDELRGLCALALNQVFSPFKAPTKTSCRSWSSSTTSVASDGIEASIGDSGVSTD
jgi:hypothetical protein